MFKQNMQISFYQYVIQQRLLEAKRLLMKKNRFLPSRPNAVFLITTPFTAPSKRITVSIRANMSAYHIKAIHGEVGGLSL